jgi:hypothetical protein
VSEVLSSRCCDYLPPLCCLGSGGGTHRSGTHRFMDTQSNGRPREATSKRHIIEGLYCTVYLEYQRVCPIVGIGSTHPLPPESECVSPQQHSLAGEAVGGPNSDDWIYIKSLALCTRYSVGHTIQGTHHPRDASSKGRIISSKGRQDFHSGTHRSGTHRYGIFRITQTIVPTEYELSTRVKTAETCSPSVSD